LIKLLYSGFAEVSNNKLIVLSETAFDVTEFKLNTYKDNVSKYEKLKNQTKNESEILFFEKKIKEINTIIEILN
jgi:F0F1-type ATP synthase epsilon subunit